MQMAIHRTNGIVSTHIPRRVNRAFKSFLDLEERFEDKINQVLQDSNKKVSESDAINTLTVQTRASLHTFQRTQARINAQDSYAL